MRIRIALLCTSLTLGLVAGCGGDDDGEEGGGGEATAPKPAGGAKTVSMKNIQFNPKSITVDRGATVEWVNEDSVGHDVTKTGGPGASFKSGSTGGMQPGATYSQTFRTAGTIEYVCRAHAPNMSGKVVIR
jgi:plastocyanin